MRKIYLTTENLIDCIDKKGLVHKINQVLTYAAGQEKIIKIHAIPRGGIPASYLIMKYVDGVNYEFINNSEHADIIIDDLIDSGETRKRILTNNPTAIFLVLIDKQNDEEYKDKWLIFPWEGTVENDHSADDIVTRLLEYIGEDPTREGLIETPKRVLKAWDEWFDGYKYGEDEIAGLMKVFEDGAEGVRDELVIVADIPFQSFCEHHIAAFNGIVSIGYISNGKILGLSKFARLTEVFAHRLQVQERMTSQIALALVKNLSPDVMVVTDKTTHTCMCSRGIKSHGTNTITSSIHGKFRENFALRAEFLSLIGRR